LRIDGRNSSRCAAAPALDACFGVADCDYGRPCTGMGTCVGDTGGRQ
jgi:hypothetical protein